MLLKQQSEKFEEECDQLSQQLESSKVKKVLSWPRMSKLWIALSNEYITIHRYQYKY